MEEVPENVSFPQVEEGVLEFWDKIDAFQTSLKLSEGRKEYSFYDGPPFATGLPHYGHILAGTIKDTVTRYAHQTGHHVIRRFGWDTHGLPIEFEIDKALGIKTKDDVMRIGIPTYNAECRNIVMRYSSEWEKVVKRLGRWIDMKNNYKTLDPSFMESVWWVFATLYEKGFVYRGFKVMSYSTGCTTPISNFEATMSYKEVPDPSVFVTFPLEDEPDVSLIAWTTTPWTLPSNLALCVNPEFDYVKIFDKQRKTHYILAKARLEELYKGGEKSEQIEIKETFKGVTLLGKKYHPLFNYFIQEKSKGAFQVVVDSYVTDTSGTGIVHQAPAFGEDDYRICLANGIIVKGEGLPCPVDDSGRFTKEVPEHAGKYIKDADKDIIKMLKSQNRLVLSGSIVHSYPFCWRSDTPLIYKAVPSWFVRVEEIRDRLLKNNDQTYWVPESIKEGRFSNWLRNSIDWAVSRNRYWGTPIPIWQSEDRQEVVVIDSIKKLEELSGVKGITDLHRESIDHITIPSKTGKGVLRRVDEVFDCWFESGSMPYAQQHYPFENKERFERSFPADFIAEGIDQTRGWFYTLMVLSTALFDRPPFKNLIANGLVLAADGKKMSKRLKNYPDPGLVVNLYGADSLRMYLINSPVVKAEDLRFQEKGVKDVVKDLLLPWFNAYRFCVQNARRYEAATNQKFVPNPALSVKSSNVMDEWVLASVQSLVKFVRQEMDAYRLYTVMPKLVKFIEQLTNWYVRLNRKRLKGSSGNEDAYTALNVLFEVLFTLCKAMAPFTPFFTEYVYQNLKKALPKSTENEDSVHYLMFPTAREEAINTRIEEAVSRMQTVIELGRSSRDRRKTPIKFPLKNILVIHPDAQFLEDLNKLKPYILEELNIQHLELTSDEGAFVEIELNPDHKALGKRLRGNYDKVREALKTLSQSQLREFQKNGKISVLDSEITSEEVKIIRKFKGDSAKQEASWDNDVLTVLDLETNKDLVEQGLAREVINRVQRLRKKAGLIPSDPIEVFYQVPEGKGAVELLEAIEHQNALIFSTTQVALINVTLRTTPHGPVYKSDLESKVGDTPLHLWVAPLSFAFDEKGLERRYNQAVVEEIKLFVLSRDYPTLRGKVQAEGKYSFKVRDTQVELTLGKDLFLTTADKLKVLAA
eukprot:TRINITY_DN4871_c0_g1_i1.p1 TRINITY_DN4871_c0_g1~~TRINITY_DN4871_c0_g1_i1.p1  ORF type:complete len:1147 (+),score=303.12 TRINITY_DN4871_c0_g1_i1:201-3641(+)